MMVDLSFAIMHVTVSIAIIQLEVSAALSSQDLKQNMSLSSYFDSR